MTTETTATEPRTETILNEGPRVDYVVHRWRHDCEEFGGRIYRQSFIDVEQPDTIYSYCRYCECLMPYYRIDNDKW